MKLIFVYLYNNMYILCVYYIYCLYVAYAMLYIWFIYMVYDIYGVCVYALLFFNQNIENQWA